MGEDSPATLGSTAGGETRLEIAIVHMARRRNAIDEKNRPPLFLTIHAHYKFGSGWLHRFRRPDDALFRPQIGDGKFLITNKQVSFHLC